MVAQRLSKLLRGGEVIELASDLGGGKTTLVQGLARGLGYSSAVTSPTFTLSNIYILPGGNELHHYDLYRLSVSGVIAHEIGEDMGSPTIITVIEWAGLLQDLLPIDRLRINFEVTGDTARRLVFSSGGPVSAALIQGLKA